MPTMNVIGIFDPGAVYLVMKGNRPIVIVATTSPAARASSSIPPVLPALRQSPAGCLVLRHRRHSAVSSSSRSPFCRNRLFWIVNVVAATTWWYAYIHH